MTDLGISRTGLSNPPLALRNPHPFRAPLYRYFRGPDRIAEVMDLALATGVSEKTAERWTNGQSEPSGADLQIIADAFPETEAAIAAVMFRGKVLVSDAAKVLAALAEAEAQLDAARKAMALCGGTEAHHG